MSPCQISIYYRLRPPHSISIMGKGKCVAPIDRLTLFDICFISCSDCHSLRAFSTARYSQHSSYFTRMGLLVKCGLAALRRHLALPPYESSIRVLKVTEFVNSIFPSIFRTALSQWQRNLLSRLTQLTNRSTPSGCDYLFYF